LFADLVEFRDGLLRVGDGLQQIVPLAAEESKSLFALVIFLERIMLTGPMDSMRIFISWYANPRREAPRPKAGQEFRDQISG